MLYIYIYIFIYIYIYICTYIYIYIICSKCSYFVLKHCKRMFSNMFICTENDTGSHKSIKNKKNLEYKTHPKHPNTFSTIQFFQKYISVGPPGLSGQFLS